MIRIILPIRSNGGKKSDTFITYCSLLEMDMMIWRIYSDFRIISSKILLETRSKKYKYVRFLEHYMRLRNALIISILLEWCSDYIFFLKAFIKTKYEVENMGKKLVHVNSHKKRRRGKTISVRSYRRRAPKRC